MLLRHIPPKHHSNIIKKGHFQGPQTFPKHRSHPLPTQNAQCLFQGRTGDRRHPRAAYSFTTHSHQLVVPPNMLQNLSINSTI